jgi:hypothetical protein
MKHLGWLLWSQTGYMEWRYGYAFVTLKETPEYSFMLVADLAGPCLTAWRY